MWLSIVLVLLFVLVGGFFSMSELALVSLRESQVRGVGGKGKRGAAVVRLRGNTNRFLSSVQIGVTLAGFFASAYGGAQLAGPLKPVLAGLGVPVAVAGGVALVVITVLVSYLSLVLGELVPKRIALQRTERVALLVSPTLDRIAHLTRPLVWLLGASTDLVVRLIGLNPNAATEEVSEEELRDMVSSSGQLGSDERTVLTDVFEAAGRRLSEVMIPRTEVAFLRADLDVGIAADDVQDQPHSRYPVTGESTDDIVGFVHVRDVLTAARTGFEGTLSDLARQVTRLPGTVSLLPALSELRSTRSHLAVVTDEYGGTDGIVTLEDLVEELVGEIEDEYDAADPTGPPRSLSGAVEVDGLLHRLETTEQTTLVLPDGPFDTLGGFVVTCLGRMPGVGDLVEELGHRLTVVEMDGRRVDRVRVEPLEGPGDGEEDDEGGERHDRSKSDDQEEHHRD